MNYKKFKDLSLSTLGMGNMRLPQITDENGEKKIDYETGQKMVDYCMENEVNYYDTAYIYHGGQSEVFLGKALSKYPRDSYYIADKYHKAFEPDYKLQFTTQLERLGVDYIDFYLLHDLSDHSADAYLTNGCIDYFMEQKRLGKIKYLGFSSHGTPELLRRITVHHQWDFAQIQLNYYDWKYQTAKEEYEILRENNIPIMVMEPVHGGLLANLPEKSDKMLKEMDAERSGASWALRWVMSLPGIQVILSGMSNMDHVKDNIATFAEGKPLNDEEKETVMKSCEFVHESVGVLCTSCRYCVDYCPQGLDIPSLLSSYNEFKLGGFWRIGRL